MRLRILARHRGRTSSTWVLGDGNGRNITIRAFLESVDPGRYTYNVVVDDGRHVVRTDWVQVSPADVPKGLEKEVLRRVRSWLS